LGEGGMGEFCLRICGKIRKHHKKENPQRFHVTQYYSILTLEHLLAREASKVCVINKLAKLHSNKKCGTFHAFT